MENITNSATDSLDLSIKSQEQKTNILGSIYYDTDWWKKPFAVEWWSDNGHFNEVLYRDILFAKLNS
jgi:hypothetical protein